MAERRSHGRETQVSSLPRFGYSSRNPSFSSSLLDAIYRSIDLGEDEVMFYGGSVKTQDRYFHGGGGGGFIGVEKEQGSMQRASMIEKWIEEKRVHGKIGERRKSTMNYGSAAVQEVDLFQRPKPVRTTVEKSKSKSRGGDEIEAGGRFSKTKSRAMKIYGDLKKAKQPISPGGKLVEILNSLFTGNQKKHKIRADTHSGNTSTCSSASSFSRSTTTNKTPSSTSAAAGKKSVRFSSENPTRTTIRNAINEELMIESSKNIRNCHESVKAHLRKNQNETPDEDLEDDDGASCASSDLFELENLSAIGIIDKYEESGVAGDEEDELPVYETTNLHTNRAIAKGIIL